MRNDDRLSALPSADQVALDDFVRRLAERFGQDVRHVIVFGSKAGGRWDDESDIDVLVVIRERPEGDRAVWRAVMDAAWESELANGVVMSPLVRGERDYARMRAAGLLLARNIDRDGIELWTSTSSAPTSAVA